MTNDKRVREHHGSMSGGASPATGASPHVCFFGTFDKERHPRVLVLMEGLQARGWQVTVQNAPLRVDTHARVAVMRQPWRIAPILLPLIAAWRHLWSQARIGPKFDVVIVGYFGYFDIHIARMLHRHAFLVLDDLAPLVGTTEDRGLDRGWQRGALVRVERAAVEAADLTVVDTHEHERQDVESTVVAVGAPDRWFRAPRTTPSGDGPMRVVFFGLFTPLQGTTIIAKAILHVTRDIIVTMIGTGQDHGYVTELLRNENDVHFVDWVDAHSLPEVIADHDVCLGIFGTTSKAQRVVPNKVFQGMAAGCAVITSDTRPQRRLLGDAALFVPPGDSYSLARELDSLAANREVLAKWRERARSRAERHFASDGVVSVLDHRLRAEIRP